MDVVQPSAAVESSESFKYMNGKKASEESSPSARASLDAHGSAGRRLSVDAFDINTPPFNSDHFRMYRMKIERCPKNRPHDWTMVRVTPTFSSSPSSRGFLITSPLLHFSILFLFLCMYLLFFRAYRHDGTDVYAFTSRNNVIVVDVGLCVYAHTHVLSI